MSKINMILIIIVISVLVIFFTPVLLEYFIFRNNIYSVLSNSEWGSFLGSYIGGLFGGIGTLIAVYITTKETRKIQEENSEQIKNEREINDRKERKQFSDSVAEDIARYSAYIKNYIFLSHNTNNLYKEKNMLEKKLINTKNLSYEGQVIDELKKSEFELQYKIQDIINEIKLNKPNITMADEYYFIIKIKLESIGSVKDIINQLKEVIENEDIINQLKEVIENEDIINQVDNIELIDDIDKYIKYIFKRLGGNLESHQLENIEEIKNNIITEFYEGSIRKELDEGIIKKEFHEDINKLLNDIIKHLENMELVECITKKLDMLIVSKLNIAKLDNIINQLDNILVPKFIIKRLKIILAAKFIIYQLESIHVINSKFIDANDCNSIIEETKKLLDFTTKFINEYTKID